MSCWSHDEIICIRNVNFEKDVKLKSVSIDPALPYSSKSQNVLCCSWLCVLSCLRTANLATRTVSNSVPSECTSDSDIFIWLYKDIFLLIFAVNAAFSYVHTLFSQFMSHVNVNWRPHLNNKFSRLFNTLTVNVKHTFTANTFCCFRSCQGPVL